MDCSYIQNKVGLKTADQALADDREEEEEDKLGPLRPLPPSKSAPTMPLVKEPAERVILRNKSDAGKSVPKSVSALTLLMPPPQLGEHAGRKQLTLLIWMLSGRRCIYLSYVPGKISLKLFGKPEPFLLLKNS